MRAEPPNGLERSGDAGLKYIVLSWDKVMTADSYLIYVNDTEPRVIETDETSHQVQNLKQNTIYLFNVASVNMAGVGANTSIVLSTSDISEFFFVYFYVSMSAGSAISFFVIKFATDGITLQSSNDAYLRE